MEELLLRVVKDSHEVDLLKDPLHEEVVLVLLESIWILVDLLEHGSPEALGHFGQSLNREVTVSIDIEAFTFYTTEALWDLRV